MFTYTQTTKNTDSVVHLNQHMSSNHTLHKRQISVKSKMVILYLAGTLMEYFLEVSALLWLWKFVGFRQLLRLIIKDINDLVHRCSDSTTTYLLM